MMIANFPITSPIGSDADIIMAALNARTEALKSEIDSQSLVTKIMMSALKAIGCASAIVSVASIPAAAVMFTAGAVGIGALALTLSILCLGVYILLDPKSPEELVVREQWQLLFQSLRKGDGKEILDACQKLVEQKQKHLKPFKACLGLLEADDTAAFFHKACLAGYLQIAVKHLKNRDYAEARANGFMALSHFERSGFSDEVKDFLNEIIEFHGNVQYFFGEFDTEEDSCVDLHILDYLVSNFRLDCFVSPLPGSNNLCVKYCGDCHGQITKETGKRQHRHNRGPA